MVVDDASSDKTVEAAVSTKISGDLVVYRKSARTGKPQSIVIGTRIARGRYVTYLDADMEYPPQAVAELLKTARDIGADIVVAVRVDRRPMHRRVISTGARILAKMLVKELRGLKDPTTELVLVKREALAGIDLARHAHHIKPLTTLLREAAKRGYKTAEVHVEVIPREQGKSSFKPRWVLQYLRQLMELSDWVLPKYVAVAGMAALIARFTHPLLGAASLALSIAIRYTALRRHITLIGLLASEAASTTAKTLLLSTLGPLGLAMAGAIETLVVTILRK